MCSVLDRGTALELNALYIPISLYPLANLWTRKLGNIRSDRDQLSISLFSLSIAWMGGKRCGVATEVQIRRFLLPLFLPPLLQSPTSTSNLLRMI